MDAGHRRERAYEPVWRWASSSCGDKAAHGEPCENAKQAIWWSGAEGGREACVWERQPRSICQQTVTKGAWRGLFSPDAIHRQFVRARLPEPGPKTGEQLEPSLVIDQRGPPRTSSRCEWRQKRDKTRRVFNIAVIKWRRRTLAPPLSWGIHRAKREVSPLLVINIFTTTTEKCTSGSRFGINWGLMLDN